MTTWHIVTGEYPPAPGGVSDYTCAVAGGLAAAGDVVHVWCPAVPGVAAANQTGVEVHAITGGWTKAGIVRMNDALNAIPGPKKLLVQWVPHAFGRRSLNVGFCRWIRRRAAGGDIVDLMVHEPCLAFGEGSLRHHAAAAVHRLMLALLLRGARRVWIAIPAWAGRLEPWAFGRRDIRFCWLPVPATIPVATANGAVSRFRADVLARPDGIIIGHFSTYPPDVRRALSAILPGLLAAVPEAQIQLLGRGSEAAAGQLRSEAGASASRILASGELDAALLSCHLQACDLVAQPYPDGASTRRTTLMAALAHGVPVVTTIGLLSEPFWESSGAVASVPAGDMAAMTRAVAELAREPAALRQLASSARDVYDARFGLPHVIEALRADACGAE